MSNIQESLVIVLLAVIAGNTSTEPVCFAFYGFAAGTLLKALILEIKERME